MSRALVAFFAVAVLLRLASLYISRRNEARLRAGGAVEFGAANSRMIAILHVAFYALAFAEGWWRSAQLDRIGVAGIALYAFAMLVLLYVINALGRLWTVKVLLAPDHVLERGWLFRAVRHPNYFLNILPELVGLALAMKAWVVLAVVLPCYVAALVRRIRIEEQAMKTRFPDFG